ncbi:hypothetical protein HZA99_00630 [Candidatus Woesearchaeota archaeon]|nr:hypothetical protein [Candidatus Woesearchaeota archaeon]
MALLDDLESIFIEEYESASILIKHAKQKSATVLLSKALFALVDYLLLKKYQKFPKSYTERFRLLEAKEKELYAVVDSVWSKYTDTYSKPSSEEAITLLKNTIQEIITTNETNSEKIKAIVGKK